MMNTQALDALAAALSGSAPTPPSSVINNNVSSYALIARQLQEAQAAAAAHQSQQSAQQAALPTVSSDVMQAYLARAGLGQHHILAPSNAPRTVALDHGAGLATGLSGGHLASFAGLRANHPDPNAEARAMVIKILMAQQQHQQQQPQLQQPQLQPQQQQPQQHQPLQQQPQMQPQQQYSPQMQPQQQYSPQMQPQQQYSLPSIALDQSPAAPLVTHQAPYAAAVEAAVCTPAATHFPQAVQYSSSYNPPVMAQHPKQDTTPPTQVKECRPQSPPSAKRPPPKKRHVRQASGQGGEGLGNSAFKSVMSEWEDKKLAKRAANRVSAHQSRKRKKMFVEDLKDENAELRRKEQILQSIPDLIIVFDSSGRMPFVSHSVTRFMNYTSEELENTSFWDCLTQDSARLVKSAFLDALAVKRPPEEDSTPLWDGESTMVELAPDTDDEDGKLVSLKGVVHFSGDSPECVCSIRSEDRPNKNASSPNTTSSPLSDASSGVIAGTNQQRRPDAAAAASIYHRISDVDSDKGNLI